MAKGRIGAGGPFLVKTLSGSFTTTVKIRPIVVISFQTNVRQQLRSRFKTRTQLGKVFGKKPNFPAAIWVTSAVTKRANLNKRLVTRWALGEPTVVITVVTTKAKATKIVSLVKFRQARPKTNVKFIPKFGKTTTKPKVVGPTVVEFVSKQRKPLRGRVVLRKPTVPVVVVVQSTKRQVRILLNKVVRKQIKTKFGFTKIFGKPTKRPNIRPVKYLAFAVKEAIKKNKYVLGTVVIGKVPRQFGVSPTGSVVVFYDGLSVADGLTYHKGLSRPHIVLIPNGDGTYTVIKDGTITDMRADILSKETYLIDGDLP